jgi:hypothetical protein
MADSILRHVGGRVWRRAGGGTIALLLALGASRPAAADLVLTFTNANPDYTADNVYITFGGANTGLAGTINSPGAPALVLGQSYALSQLEGGGTNGVTLSNFNSGRVYVSLGAPLTVNAANSYNPNFANPGLADYGTRWDKVELSFTNGVGGANLSAQDFFSVKLQASASGGGQPATSLTWMQSSATVMQTLGGLSGFSVNSAGNPQGALVTGAGGVPIPAGGSPGLDVIRVISPATVTPGPNGSTVYPSFSAYLAHLENSGGTPVATRVAGNNGAGQAYDFTATIANASYGVGGTTVQAGDLLLTGTVNTGGGPMPTTAVVRAANMTDYAVYGASPSFTVSQGADTNGMVTRAMADYFSGLNFGLVGSPEINPFAAADGLPVNTTFGASPTWTWYGNNPNGVNQTAISISYAYAAAQPTQPGWYNLYASDLTTVSDAYGFAYNDRLQSPLASLANGSTLNITVLRDGQGVSNGAPGANPIPEPSGMLALAVGGLALLRRSGCPRRRRDQVS